MDERSTRYDEALDSDIWLPAPEGDEIDSNRDAGARAALHPTHAVNSRTRVAVWLFLATAASMFVVGMQPGGSGLPLLLVWNHVKPAVQQQALWNGLTYAAALLAILGAHEMGHYLQTRRYRVPSTLPFFIPLPISPFGTMGAVILQDGRTANRRMLFDIAVSGPLAGLVLAIPIVCLGVQQADVKLIPPDGDFIRYGDPILIKWLAAWMKPQPLAPGHDLILNPLLFAGWVGIFITALNLIPIGQLDGGHILYTLIGRKAHVVAIAVLALAVGYMIYSRYYAYSVLVVLLLLMGPRHPPTADDRVPLGPVRHVLGWLTLAFIVIGFTPMPIITM